MIDDGLDIPAFLKIPQTDRVAAWANYKPTGTANGPAPDDCAPGSVCRRAGMPDGINKEFVAALEAQEAAERATKREESLARLRAWKADQAEIEAVKAAARAAHSASSSKIESAAVSGRAPSKDFASTNTTTEICHVNTSQYRT